MFSFEVTAGLLMGLASSLHCAVMCGPLNILLHADKEYNLNSIGGLGVYHIGRISTYVFIGLLFGFLGSMIQLKYIQQAASIFGAIIILLYISTQLSRTLEHRLASTKLFQGIKNVLITHISRPSQMSRLYSGIFNGFLPCGMVYLAASTAAISGSVSSSVQFMFFFGLGTLPALILVPLIAKSFQPIVGKNMKFLSTGLLIIVGLLFLARGFNFSHPILSWLGITGPEVCN